MPDPPHQPQRPDRRPARTTETPLELPSLRRVLAIAGRVLRLRCPNCGRGRVLASWSTVHRQCTGCGLRFTRSDDNYFSGAMFFGLLMGEGIFAVTLFATILIAWPHVPWDALTYLAPIGMVVVMLLMVPFAKVLWLGVDLLIRPATAAELEPSG